MELSRVLFFVVLSVVVSVGGVAAQQGSADLGDYPELFAEGGVDTRFVVGESASPVDVAGAVGIAGSLGDASASNTGYGFSVEGGVGLSTARNDLRFGDRLDRHTEAVTEKGLPVLESSVFSEGSVDTRIEHRMYPPDNRVRFGKPEGGEDEDPVVHVRNPEDPDAKDHLFRVRAEFGDAVDLTSRGVQGEDIRLFGRERTVSGETTDERLVLETARYQVSVSSPGSQTVTVGGEEVSFGVESVSGPRSAVVSVNDEVQEVDEDDTFSVNGEEVRAAEVILMGQDSGTVVFAVDSKEMVVSDGSAVEDGSGDEVGGLYGELHGSVSSLEAVDLYVGSQRGEDEYVAAGGVYSHDPLPYRFGFESLNPDAVSGGVGVGSVEVSSSGDDALEVRLDTGAGLGEAGFLHRAPSGLELSDGDGDDIKVVEGSTVREDEYFVADAGGFGHLWGVEDVDRDATRSEGVRRGDDAVLELEDAFTGRELEVDVDAVSGGDGVFGSGDGAYAGSEVVDGQSLFFEVSADSDPRFQYAYGEDAGFDTDGAVDVDTGASGSGSVTAFPSVETEGGAKVAFYDPGQSPAPVAVGEQLFPFAEGEEMYVDADSSGSYEDGDDILTGIVEERDGTGTPGDYAGEVVRNFGQDIVYSDASPKNGGYDGGEAVVNDTNSNRVFDADPDFQDPVSGLPGSAILFNDADGSGGYERGRDSVVLDADGSGSIDGNDIVLFQGSGTANDLDGTGVGEQLDGTAGVDQLPDSDTPVSSSRPTPPVAFVDDGGSGYSRSDSVYLDLTSPDSGGDTVAAGDLRLSPSAGFGAGTLVSSADADTGLNLEDPPAAFLFNDADGSSGYSADDPVYLDPNASNRAPKVVRDDLRTVDYVSGQAFGSKVENEEVLAGPRPPVGASLSGFSTDSEMYVDSSANSRFDPGEDVLTGVTENVDGTGTRGDFAGNEIDDFGSDLAHDDSGGDGGKPFDSDTVVRDADADLVYDTGEKVFGGSTPPVKRFSTDGSEVDGLPDDLVGGLPGSEPALILIEEERQSGEQEAYTVTGSFDADEELLEVDAPAYSGTDRQTSELESREDVTTGLDRFGTYTEFDDDRGTLLFRYPEVQSKAGAALGAEDLSIEPVKPGSADRLGVLDTQAASSADTRRVLVGGPSANALVKELVTENRTIPASEYGEGDALIQLVDHGPASDAHSIVVAGRTAEDTRRAANRLANADENPLPGQDQVMVGTGQ